MRDQKAIDEVNEIIELLEDEDKGKIPENVREFFKKNASEDIPKRIRADIPLDKQDLGRDTAALLTYISRYFK
jgi:ribosomal protein L31E